MTSKASKTRDPRIVIDARMINHSGIGRYTREVIESAKRTSRNVELIANSSSIGSCGPLGLAIIQFRSGIYTLREQLEFFLKVGRCDLFISPHYNVPLALPKAKRRIAILPDTNHLAFARDLSLPKQVYASFFFRWASFRSKALVTISEFSKSEIVKFIGTSPERIKVILLAIAPEVFSDEPNSLGTRSELVQSIAAERFCLFVGNVKPHKNLKRSLEAFEVLLSRFPDLKFVIVGKKEKLLGLDNDTLKMLDDADSRFMGRVIATGEISDSELGFLYKRAACLLFASLYEGFGIPPLEAMHLGCPVVCSREGSLPEVCRDAVHYCDGYSASDIAEKVADMLTNCDLREELIARGKTHVQSFHWEKFRLNFSQVIQNALQLGPSDVAEKTVSGAVIK